MDYLDEDRSTIRERLRGYMQNATDENGRPLFPDQNQPGSAGYTLREVWTRIMHQHTQQLNAMIEDFSPRTARGAALDAWADYLGKPRTSASRATGRVLIKSEVTGDTLERLSGSRAVPAGTRLQGSASDLVTVDDAEIEPGTSSVEVGVESVRNQQGAAAQTGTVYSVAGRELLEAEVVRSVAGGSGAESDDQLRYRLSLAMRAPSTFEGLEGKMLADADVDDVQIDEAAYGPGTAEVFVSPAIAYPTEELRQRLETAASEGPGQVYVVFPAYEGVSLRIRVTSTPTGAEQAVTDYVNNLSAGDSLIMNDLEQVVRQSGAEDAQVIGIKRGVVGDDKSLVNPRTLQQITNLRPRNDRTEWYARPSWITICT